MKYIAILLVLGLLLSGCAAAPAQSPTSEPTAPPTIAPTETAPAADTDVEAFAPTEAPSMPELLLSQMTTEEKVGQLFFVRCQKETAVQDLETYQFGGYVLFGADFEDETPDSIRKTLSAYQEASTTPLLIAVDEEGGTVTRVSRYAAFRESPFPAPRWLYAEGGLEAVLQAEAEKSGFLRDLGINVNLAPVCDITTDEDAFMYDRSLGQDPQTTADVISAMVTVMTANQMGSVLKHFPGYGNNTDTHTAMAADSRSLEELESADLLPFAAGIDAGCGAILVSHTIVEALDPEMPATLSEKVHQYLREEMGFNGVIITDDLYMQAITDAYGAEEAAVLAVLAGNDLLCCREYEIQYPAVLEAVQSGRISQEILDCAVLRILRWKEALGLLAG